MLKDKDVIVLVKERDDIVISSIDESYTLTEGDLNKDTPVTIPDDKKTAIYTAFSGYTDSGQVVSVLVNSNDDIVAVQLFDI